ncbi:hypothetical protein ACIBBE_24530 [Streptomyces sp. NPDC051644]|uniref:hypothetical protein n=1 Tax=Streptomyces sp. NPDC051644 TaxID=3365666 RepID=UPI00378C0F94
MSKNDLSAFFVVLFHQVKPAIMLLMEKDTQSKIDRLAGVLGRLAQTQREADELMVDIATNGGHGSQAALSRLLEIKPQSLDGRITAAKNRIASEGDQLGRPR